MLKRRKRPNWPYRFAWLGLLFSLVLYVAIQTLVGALTFASRSYGTDWGLALVASCLDATIAVWFVAVGASIGSFLNVVAYRLPRSKSIGGHSSCPFCCTPIEGHDNVPVLAWIALRGRCRSCRLPISIQYPLVELTVAMVFLVVYLTEFATSGANLPGVIGDRDGILRMHITMASIGRTVTYLFALSGLLAAALIAVKRLAVPMKLYAWSVAPTALFSLAIPSLIIVRWRETLPVGMLESRLDALASLLCGCVAGVALARCVAPVIYPGYERNLLGNDRNTAGARQFLGAMALAGALVGWQSVVPLAWTIVLCQWLALEVLRTTFLSGQYGVRARQLLELDDPTVWTWLGLLVFRATWDLQLSLQFWPAATPEVVRQVVGVLMLVPVLKIMLRRRAARPESQLTENQPAEELSSDSQPQGI